jgi:GDP-L-fucose synthase
MKEEYLLTGTLEPTNEPYAIAKIAGIKLCENYFRQYGCNFFSVMPTNLYGPNDNFNLETSHVLPALIRKFHEAKINNRNEVVVWGTGKPRREFLFVDDLSSALYFLLNEIDSNEIYQQGITHINIGTGKEITINELANIIKIIVGYNGEIFFDKFKPDGAVQKLLDISRIENFGWKSKISINYGIKRTYKWLMKNY